MKSEYTSLHIRVFIQVVMAALVLVLLTTAEARDILLRFSRRFFILLGQALFSLDEPSASSIFYGILERYKLVIFLAFSLSVLLCVAFFVSSSLLRYFAHISRGVDRLLDDSEQPIVLKPELVAMQSKLNAVKTVLREQKKAAQESEQRKNDLVVYLAHDLKTPLTSVIGYLSLLQESPEIPEVQKEKYTEITLQKALRLEELINEFFDITRFNLQNMHLERSTIKLALMLEQIVDECYPLLATKNMQVQLCTDATVFLDGDANKLARVFSNLLKNAVMYGDDGTTIDITLQKQGAAIHISFKNRGPKISAQQLKHIFEKFYRLDSARSSHTGGAGLGLAIAQRIVEAHHGRITAHSDHTYTEFCVILPAIP